MMGTINGDPVRVREFAMRWVLLLVLVACKHDDLGPPPAAPPLDMPSASAFAPVPSAMCTNAPVDAGCAR